MQGNGCKLCLDAERYLCVTEKGPCGQQLNPFNPRKSHQPLQSFHLLHIPQLAAAQSQLCRKSLLHLGIERDHNDGNNEIIKPTFLLSSLVSSQNEPSSHILTRLKRVPSRRVLMSSLLLIDTRRSVGVRYTLSWRADVSTSTLEANASSKPQLNKCTTARRKSEL